MAEHVSTCNGFDSSGGSEPRALNAPSRKSTSYIYREGERENDVKFDATR
jgi:hypothetical protein